MDGVEGRHDTQSVAADVAGNGAVQIPERFKGLPVGTAHAELGRLARGGGRFGGGVPGKQLPDPAHVEFPETELFGLALHGDPHGVDVVGKKVVALVHHDAALHAGNEGADEFPGQRPGEAQLQDRRIGSRFTHMLIGDARGDDPQFGALAYDLVPAALFIQRGHGGQIGPQPPVGQLRKGGHHDVGTGIPHIFGPAGGEPDPAPVEDALGVADPRGHPEQHRRTEFVRQTEGFDEEVIALLRIGRLEHGDARAHRVAPVVLFVLAGGHAGIVGGDHHHAPRRAGVGDGEEGICRHVEPHVLHGDEAPAVGQGHADAHFEGAFFVGSPFGGAAETGEFVEDLG